MINIYKRQVCPLANKRGVHKSLRCPLYMSLKVVQVAKIVLFHNSITTHNTDKNKSFSPFVLGIKII
jgi:hypothetical protein